MTAGMRTAGHRPSAGSNTRAPSAQPDPGLPPRSTRLAPDAPVHLLALTLDTPTLMRQTRLAAEGRAEAGFAVHAAFRRFFGAADEPFTFHVEPSQERRTLVWAYSRHRLDVLERLAAARLVELVSDGKLEVAALMPFRFKLAEELELPIPTAGMRLAVAVRCTPLRMSEHEDPAAAGKVVEYDAFSAGRRALLARFEAEGTPALDRQALTHLARSKAYRDWLGERLKGCRIEAFGLDRFELARVLRGTAGARRQIKLPVADMRATIVVDDATPPAYGSLRHRFAGRGLQGGGGWTKTLGRAWTRRSAPSTLAEAGPRPGADGGCRRAASRTPC